MDPSNEEPQLSSHTTTNEISWCFIRRAIGRPKPIKSSTPALLLRVRLIGERNPTLFTANHQNRGRFIIRNLRSSVQYCYIRIRRSRRVRITFLFVNIENHPLKIRSNRFCRQISVNPRGKLKEDGYENGIQRTTSGVPPFTQLVNARILLVVTYIQG